MSNPEFRISKLNCSRFSFDIHYSIFDLPAMPSSRFEIGRPVLTRATDTVAVQSTSQGRRVFSGSSL